VLYRVPEPELIAERGGTASYPKHSADQKPDRAAAESSRREESRSAACTVMSGSLKRPGPLLYGGVASKGCLASTAPGSAGVRAGL